MSATVTYAPVDVTSVDRASTGMRIAGWIVGTLPALFLLMDGVMKIVPPKMVLEETEKMHFPISALLPLGIILTLSMILYLIPRTAVIGAILATGYLGGAVCVHVWSQHPTWKIFFPAVFAVFLWTGLAMRSLKFRRVAFRGV